MGTGEGAVWVGFVYAGEKHRHQLHIASLENDENRNPNDERMPNDEAPMILTINGGSSTVKYAGYSANGGFAQLFKGKLEGRGEGLIESLSQQIGDQKGLGIGHRVVHPGL